MPGICSTTETHPLPYSGFCCMSGSVVFLTGFNHDFPSQGGHVVYGFTLGVVQCERLLMKTWKLILFSFLVLLSL